jgi:hypothetical protein
MYKYLFIVYVAVNKEDGLFIILPVDKGMHSLEDSHLLVCDTMQHLADGTLGWRLQVPLKFQFMPEVISFTVTTAEPWISQMLFYLRDTG